MSKYLTKNIKQSKEEFYKKYPSQKIFYDSIEWKKKRSTILKRDGLECVKCSSMRNLQIHHLNSAWYVPELAFNNDNLITLCRICHEKTK